MQCGEKVALHLSRMRKIARYNTDMGHIVGYDYVRCIQYVLIIRASRLIALKLVVFNRCILYVLQVHCVKRSKDGISPSCYELPIYVLQLHLLAECHTPISTIGDELRKCVRRLLITAKCNTTRVTISDELL